MRKINLFISYSHEDKDYLKELKVYLNDKTCPDINIWDDGKITAGAEWDDETKNRLDESQIVLLLISQSFLNSNYINKIELKHAIEKHDQKKCRVIPIFVRSCNLEKYPQITKLQGLPNGMKFLSDINKTDSHYREIQDAVNEVTNEMITNKNMLHSISQKISQNDAKSIDEGWPYAQNSAFSVVRCSVFAPSVTSPGQNVLVQVFAHLQGQEEIVKSLASDFDKRAKLKGIKQLDKEIKRGSKLTFHLSMQGIDIDEPVQYLIWREQAEAVQFGISIPRDHPVKDIIGTVYVIQDSIPFGHVKFILRVKASDLIKKTEDIKPITGENWNRYKNAFISYASADRSEVLKRVQMLSRAHIQFFQDILTLEPGQRWEKELHKHIDQCDVFFLFWSKAAKSSQWVMQEVQYALNRHEADKLGNPEIIPVIIEGPPPVAPPPELKDLHFNDTFIYFINAPDTPNRKRFLAD